MQIKTHPATANRSGAKLFKMREPLPADGYKNKRPAFSADPLYRKTMREPLPSCGFIKSRLPPFVNLFFSQKKLPGATYCTGLFFNTAALPVRGGFSVLSPLCQAQWPAFCVVGMGFSSFLRAAPSRRDCRLGRRAYCNALTLKCQQLFILFAFFFILPVYHIKKMPNSLHDTRPHVKKSGIFFHHLPGVSACLGVAGNVPISGVDGPVIFSVSMLDISCKRHALHQPRSSMLRW